jgi:hypothetical protein
MTDVVLREFLIDEVGERRAAPQLARPIQHRVRGFEIAELDLMRALRDEVLDQVRVECLGI